MATTPLNYKQRPNMATTPLNYTPRPNTVTTPLNCKPRPNMATTPLSYKPRPNTAKRPLNYINQGQRRQHPKTATPKDGNTKASRHGTRSFECDTNKDDEESRQLLSERANLGIFPSLLPATPSAKISKPRFSEFFLPPKWPGNETWS